MFVSILVFEPGFKIRARVLLKNLTRVLLLAIPLMIVAAGVFFGLNHPTGFAWLAALMCGVILSATDPVAVVAPF